MDGVLDHVWISVDQPTIGVGSLLPPLVFACAVIATCHGPFEEPSSGIGPLRTEVSRMAQDLALAQAHAFSLSRILMVPITLFKSGDEFGVLPSDELDDEDDLEIVHEYAPF
jgi:hypothetical protein